MREILFRGKRVDNGEWVEGFYVEANQHWHNKGVHKEWILKNVIQNGGWCNIAGKYAVIPETVGQYTGLTDKNGTKIFEGDIVHCVARLDEADCIVVYDDGEFRLVAEDRYKDYPTLGGYYALHCFEKEVIGNIHDN